MPNPYAAKRSAKGAPEPEAETQLEQPQGTETEENQVEAPEQEQEQVEPQQEQAPLDGSVKEILEWVGDDKDRAQAALDQELKGKGRKTLLNELEEILEKD